MTDYNSIHQILDISISSRGLRGTTTLVDGCMKWHVSMPRAKGGLPVCIPTLMETPERMAMDVKLYSSSASCDSERRADIRHVTMRAAARALEAWNKKKGSCGILASPVPACGRGRRPGRERQRPFVLKNFANNATCSADALTADRQASRSESGSGHVYGKHPCFALCSGMIWARDLGKAVFQARFDSSCLGSCVASDGSGHGKQLQHVSKHSSASGRSVSPRRPKSSDSE